VNIINAPVVGDARVRKAAGSRDAGNMTLTLYPDDGDAGQTAVAAANVAALTYPIKIEYPSASKVTSGGTVAIRYFWRLWRAVARHPSRQRGHRDGRIHVRAHNQAHARLAAT
jgi:hypothetical protein